MLDVRYSAKFKKDYKTIIKRGYNPQLLEDVLTILCNEQPLPPKYKEHSLSGNYEGHRECHITPSCPPFGGLLFLLDWEGRENLPYLIDAKNCNMLFSIFCR